MFDGLQHPGNGGEVWGTSQAGFGDDPVDEIARRDNEFSLETPRGRNQHRPRNFRRPQ
jgi:hypothetical protein